MNVIQVRNAANVITIWNITETKMEKNSSVF